MSSRNRRMVLRRIPVPLYIPNVLCYIRIVLSFASIYTSSLIPFTKSPIPYIHLTAIIWIVASALDHLDGKLARCFNQCSKFGVLLDIISDNILRGSSWIACIIVHNSHGRDLNEKISTSTWVLPVIIVGLISIEWVTMFSTQMTALLRKKNHWKEMKSLQFDSVETGDVYLNQPLVQSISQPPEQNTNTNPWIIERIFRNNFCNVLGVITIFGSMGTGMIHFLHLLRVPLLNEYPWFYRFLDALRMLAYAGRFLALYAECWFCFDYFRMLVNDHTTLDDTDKDVK